MNDLKKIREKIDQVDKKIVYLFEERMELTNEVAEFKKENNKQVFDKKREEEKIEKIRSYTKSSFNEKGAEELFSQIMAISRKFQYQKLNDSRGIAAAFKMIKEISKKDIKVVYQGMPGSYSEEATKKYFGKSAICSYEKSFQDIMETITSGNANYGVLPIENSTAGIVHEIFDLLVSYDAFILGEQVIPINHCLLAKKKMKIEDINRVYSHPQSIMQSAGFLNEHPKMQAIRMENNAFAARKVAEDNVFDQAAIASENAAQIYGLEILQKQVNDELNNSTRFIIISNEKLFLKEADKISICFEVSNESASLYRALSHIIFNDLNMTKIESRPITNKSWEYRFFVDFEGNLKDASVQNALSGLQEETLNLKILGNYI
jgi:chorismate mutase/prephenate dehydratase